jgi:hypothetical protein
LTLYPHLGRANCFTQLARNATFLPTRVSAKSMLSTESRTERSFLERIIDCDLKYNENKHTIVYEVIKQQKTKSM